MYRISGIYFIVVALSLLTLLTTNACAQPALNRTTTGFTVVHPESKRAVEVLVTFKQDGTLLKVERCFSDKSSSVKKCEPLELKDQKELYSCVPVENEKNIEGEKVILRNKLYDCQYITATEPNEPIIFKTGDNTSCPMIINGRYCDPCKGIF